MKNWKEELKERFRIKAEDGLDLMGQDDLIAFISKVEEEAEKRGYKRGIDAIKNNENATRKAEILKKIAELKAEADKLIS